MKKELTVEEIAELLLGTCNSLDNFVDLDNFSMKNHLELDDKVMECTTCGWWIETHDTDVINGEIVCNECIES